MKTDLWGEGMRICKSAEAAAPEGGTAFTKEAVQELSSEHSCNLVSSRRHQASIDDSSAVHSNGSMKQQRDFFSLKPEHSGTSCGLTVRTYRDAVTPAAAFSIYAGSRKSADLWTWSWDVLKSSDDSEARLPSIALKLLQPSLARGLVVSETSALNLVTSLLSLYSRLPYHNAFHAVATMHAALLITQTVPASRSALNDFDVFLLAIAALGHDAGHGGFDNAYEVASRSLISLTHGNEGPVLERYHAALTIQELKTSGVLDGLSSPLRATAIHTVLSAILATDMARHSAIVDDLKRCRSLSELTPDAHIGAIVHVADLSNHAFPRAISICWADRISAEFLAQVEMEKQSGLGGLPTASAWVSLNSPLSRSNLEMNFIGAFVAPLFKALAALADGSLDEPLHNIQQNERYYAQESSRLTAIADATHLSMIAAALESAPTLLTIALAIAPVHTVVSTALRVAPVNKVLPALLAASAPFHEVLEAALTVTAIDDVLPVALAIAPLRDVVSTALKVAPVKIVLPALLAAAAPFRDVFEVLLLFADAKEILPIVFEASSISSMSQMPLKDIISAMLASGVPNVVIKCELTALLVSSVSSLGNCSLEFSRDYGKSTAIQSL